MGAGTGRSGAAMITISWQFAPTPEQQPLYERYLRKRDSVTVGDDFRITWAGDRDMKPAGTSFQENLVWAETQFNKVGGTLGDLEAFFNADKDGWLGHVIDAINEACIIRDAAMDMDEGMPA